jgi:hypothetical protein
VIALLSCDEIYTPSLTNLIEVLCCQFQRRICCFAARVDENCFGQSSWSILEKLISKLLGCIAGVSAARVNICNLAKLFHDGLGDFWLVMSKD